MNESTQAETESSEQETESEQWRRPLMGILYEPILFGAVGAVVMAVLFVVGLAISDSFRCTAVADARCERAEHQVQMKRSARFDEKVEQERLFTTTTLEYQRNVFELCLSLKDAQVRLDETAQKKWLIDDLLTGVLPPIDGSSAASQRTNVPISLSEEGRANWPAVCEQAYQGVSDGVLIKHRQKALKGCGVGGVDCETTNATETWSELETGK